MVDAKKAQMSVVKNGEKISKNRFSNMIRRCL